MSHRKKILIGIILFLAIAVVVVYPKSPIIVYDGGLTWRQHIDLAEPITPNSSQPQNSDSDASELAFAEMTVPYLRNRSYESALGELREVSQNGSYTAYLTNYDSDGLYINGLLTVPQGEMPEGGWPAVVFIHGYIPPAQYSTQTRYEDYVGYLARNGLVVFKIDLRGHGESEGEPGGAYYSADYIIDTLNARAALRATDFVDPDGIGLWGHSMAGNVVLRSMAARPEIPAAVIWAGAVYSYEDFQNFGLSDNSYRRPSNNTQRSERRQNLFDTHGTFSPDSPYWQQVAATNYLADLQGAIQLHHAVDDNVVNVGYSRGLIDLLDEAQVNHQLYEYQNGGHNLTGSSFSQAMQRTTDFFKSNL